MNIVKQTLRCGMTIAIILLTGVANMAQDPVPPPSSAPKLSADDLDALVAPIALYPDPLVATILPASVYPLEIVQAARFVADTNNLVKLDEQPWDDNVKAVARVPDALKKLNDDLQWTIKLGEAFLAQDKDVMDAIQRLRLKTQKNGMLQTSDKMIVVVTNTVETTTIEQQVVVVTNTIVQIESANPQIIYVPQYNPVYVYAPPPTYVYRSYDPFLTFASGVVVGVWIGNGCDWHHGGCYYGGGSYNGGHNTTIKINGDVNIGSGNNNNIGNRPTQRPAQGQKWQPNQSRLNKSGAVGSTSARSQEARGYANTSARPSTGTAANLPSTGTAGTRPSTGQVGARPSTGTATARPSTGTTPAVTRPSAGSGPEIVRGAGGSPAAANRPSSPASPASRPSSPSPAARPAPSNSNNAFSGGSAASARSSSSRGTASRGGGGGGGRGR